MSGRNSIMNRIRGPAGLFLLWSTILWASPAVHGQQRSVVADSAAVVSVEKHASQAGMAMLRKGGHAVDAAIATAFALAVTYPQAGNIGGGGFMLIRTSSGEVTAIDYREKAPAAATARMFLLADGTVDTLAAEYGYRVAGVPGTVRGLETAWRLHGRLPWKELLEPAIRLAEEGFELPEFQVVQFRRFRHELSRYPETKKIFCKSDGSDYRPGERFIQRDLARTLRAIADGGADEFYAGELARKIVADFSANDGMLTLQDLQDYKAVVREPVRGTYRGHEIVGMPPPSSGGIGVIQMLNMLELFDMSKSDATRTQHVLVETMRRAFFDRARYVGDADFVEVPVRTLISKSYAARIAARIDTNVATASGSLGRLMEPAGESTETTHFSVVDREGNVVANTYTLEDNFGSKAVVRGLGFLLNNEMHDFNVNPDVGSHMGWDQNNPNLIQAGKRPLSSMSPTIVVQNGKVVLVTGSPGGRTILNTVVQVIVGVIDYRLTLREALDRPRLNHNWMPDRILVERTGWPPKLIDDLLRMGHVVKVEEFLGDAHSIWIDPSSGKIHGEADFRRMGWAEGD